MKESRLKNWFALTLVALLFLSACVAPNSQTPTPSVIAPTLESTLPTVTEEIVPTATEVVPADIQADIILWTPVDGNGSLAQDLNGQLNAYASEQNLTFLQVDQLSPVQLGGMTRVVVSLASADETYTLAQSAANVPVISVLGSAGTAVPNLYPMSAITATPDQAAFLAGYALALVTPEYRVGVISQAGTALGQQYSGGFITGARFYCGLCRSRFAPVMYYPLAVEVTDPASQADWQTAADTLLTNAISGVFVQPEISSPELISYLASKGVRLVGVEGQNGLETQADWVGVLSSSVSADVVNAVNTIIGGGEISSLGEGVDLTLVDENLMSAGKQILFERIRQQMLDGLVKTLP